MDMDDDFIGEIEFNLSPEQAELVSRAINVASSARGEDDFGNRLLSAMRYQFGGHEEKRVPKGE